MIAVQLGAFVFLRLCGLARRGARGILAATGSCRS